MKLLGLAALLVLVSTVSVPQHHDRAVNNEELSAVGNGFAYSGESYAKNESFVYTSKVTFRSGQAAGLIFGGSASNNGFVFNIDRVENKTKLLYFDNGNAVEYLNEYYMGNDKVTQSELNVIKEKVESCLVFNLKVVITPEEGHTYAEFFIDNIKRFGVDNVIDLNVLCPGVYQGGYLGYQVYSSSTLFSEIHVGKSDYSYYTEAYRNQYHYSQYAHWNNDPNGLVYYKGYYHMYYQTHPYSKQWDHMYWGHARSRDLVHWQELPYALFPDDGNMGVGLGVGYAWSGIAMVYHPGMSDDIDAKNWFPNGEGTGLLGFYTRDGACQDQVIITSDDEGMTWTKRQHISQHLIYDAGKISCRDPSIFPLKKNGEGHVTLWGMALSGAEVNRFWFLKSSNLLDWQYAGGYDYIYPECMSVYQLEDENGQPRHAISVSSRHYAVGNLTYNEMDGNVHFILPDGRDYTQVGQSAFRKMDYAEDSYAAQAFYIDDSASEYYGKTVAISWFSGLPSDAESGIYADVRDPWNGGGMTIPVELGLVNDGNDILLTQKPITVDNTHFDKTSLLSLSNTKADEDNETLSTINTHQLELAAEIDNPNLESVEFRLSVSDEEYTAFGWNPTDGYYFDRSHTSTAGIQFAKKYSHKFTSKLGDGHKLSFYALSDNGGLEFFAEDYRYAFYGLTLAAPYSIGAELVVSGEVTLTSLNVNAIGSVWHDESELEEGVLYMDQEYLCLDLSIAQTKDVMVYSTNHEEISYTQLNGEDVVSYVVTNKGIRVTALKNGTSEIEVASHSDTRRISITVDEAEVACDYPLTKEGIKSGSWHKSSIGLVGTMNGGDGYYLSSMRAADFIYSASITLDGNAAGLLMRAKEDMSDFIVANFDVNENIVKVFSRSGEIARASVELTTGVPVSYTASLSGRDLSVAINGKKAIDAQLPYGSLDDGYLGLNVFRGEAIFNNIRVTRLEYDFAGEDLVIDNAMGQYVKAIYNATEKNTLVPAGYYHRGEDDTLVIDEAYFRTLTRGITHRFYVVGEATSYSFSVAVPETVYPPKIDDLTITAGLDAIVFIGDYHLTTLTVDGTETDSYRIKDHCLRIDKSLLPVGEHTVQIDNVVTFKITVEALPQA